MCSPSPHPVVDDTESSLPWPLLTNCPAPTHSCTPTPTGRSCLRGGPGHANPSPPPAQLSPDQAPAPELSLPACSLSLPLPFTLLSHSGPLSVSAKDLGCLPRAFAHAVPFAEECVPSPTFTPHVSTVLILPRGNLPTLQPGSGPHLLLTDPCSLPLWHGKLLSLEP